MTLLLLEHCNTLIFANTWNSCLGLSWHHNLLTLYFMSVHWPQSSFSMLIFIVVYCFWLKWHTSISFSGNRSYNFKIGYNFLQQNIKREAFKVRWLLFYQPFTEVQYCLKDHWQTWQLHKRGQESCEYMATIFKKKGLRMLKIFICLFASCLAGESAEKDLPAGGAAP